ncbi:MAG TPA: SIS domain-containing protein [Candidatus Limnocylindrales bacterium]|nr:SIS domain-containing protein [Candidatus Limnocylindrales bacterium]
MGLRDEILEQPEAARRQLASSQVAIEALAARLLAEGTESVVIAARGSSDHAAIYGQYVLGVRNRLSVGLAAPSVVSLYGVEPRLHHALVIGISQSGASPDIVAVVEAARRHGAPTLAITNDPSSALATAAEYVVELAAGPERSIAATKTYVCSLLALARLSAELAWDDDERATPVRAALDRSAVAAIPKALSAALDAEAAAAEAARELAAMDRCVVLGRGYEYATAREWALKLKELAQVFADPYSSADFMHGPIALAEPDVPTLALVPDGPAAAGLVDVLTEVREAGSPTLVLSEREERRALGTRSIALPPDVPEWLRPITSIVAAQLFAYHLTVAKGLDPEAPRNLAKVTRTV